MRQLFLCLTLFLTMPAAAQITLTAADYPAVFTGTDSIKVTVSASPFPALVTGGGNMWDMTINTDSVPVLHNYHVPAAGFQYADSAVYSLFSFAFPGKTIRTQLMSGHAEEGWIVGDTTYSISPLTAYPYDSLFIPAQTDFYSVQRNILIYPATDASSWSSSFFVDLQFELSMAFPAYNHAPGYRRSYVQENCFVTGWGQMRINDANGNPGEYLDVLQVQVRRITTDSFFLNGVPMAPSVLPVFNVYQGMADTVYEHNYYRKGEITPLANVRFKDAIYTQPVMARKHVQRLMRVGVADVPTTKEVKVYPQPLTGKELMISIPPGRYAYTLYDMKGINVASGVVSATNNTCKFALPESIAAGQYLLCLTGMRSVPVTLQR